MTRVSDNGSLASVNFSINKVKERLQNLQLKGASLKNITRPSDNPVNNIEVLTLDAIKTNNAHYLRNAEFAKLQLSTTEYALQDLTDLMVKAKELAVAQASDLYDAQSRKNVSNEMIQLKNQALAISNRQIGHRRIFSGLKTLTPPFDSNQNYQGDTGKINLEISKGFFVPINLNGHEVFVGGNSSQKKNSPSPIEINHPAKKNETSPEITRDPSRDLASIDKAAQFEKRDNMLSQLDSLVAALENNDSSTIQGLLVSVDKTISRLITLRTKVGSIINAVENSTRSLESQDVNNAARKSKLLDADVAELFSDLQKQQLILKTAYQAGKTTLNQSLLDYLR
ncbi:MAG: flagellar hook-associated protein FlgL [Bdellovibrionales bacterium]|jgi:flagellar hook-associated protein 3 FlgL|nr:flagellar hook-associated protein FlgL [Bdellovibrionales bacterium]MBT3525561.1 flagellar hook-associated protein FlgL [Bdellovibrionales bacterium]MBT7767340.1 flagellar hook-associated protein FlgL [Bdellovibrionales bacterium]